MNKRKMSSTSKASSLPPHPAEGDGAVVETWEYYNSLRTNIPDSLRMRQMYGTTLNHGNRPKPITTGVTRIGEGKVSSFYLSYRGAWNATRLQNTILVVGPGTPASVVTAATANTTSAVAGTPSPADASAANTRRYFPLQAAASSSSASSSADSSSDNDDDGEEEENEDHDRDMRDSNDEEENVEQEDAMDEDDEDEKEDEEDDNTSSGSSNRRQRRRRRPTRLAEPMSLYDYLGMEDHGDDEEESDDDDDGNEDNEDRMIANMLYSRASAASTTTRSTITTPKYRPSMRHGGCINTAAWLDCGWRLSNVNPNDCRSTEVPAYGINSEECPTQLVTSGDDYLVKFWDVRDAMGMASPLPGGRATICPFSSPTSGNPHDLEEEWQTIYDTRRQTIRQTVCGSSKHSNSQHQQNMDYHLPGSVKLLASMHTGHRGNVFDVTPLKGRPGVVATCGADGFLRLTDLQRGESSIVIDPELDDDLAGVLPYGLINLRSRMCFSHHFMNQNVGLLCSERGLRRFDLRLPPREQSTRNVLGSIGRGCKACAILSEPLTPSSSHPEQGEPTYVFAGGSSPNVVLCDIRMTDQSESRDNKRIVQKYCPSGLSPADHVSVSGLDLSRNRQELLVSYESDQIYTFPVFPKSKSPGISIMGQIEELITERDICDENEEDSESSTSKSSDDGPRRMAPLHELACYGAHLNRFTFLKNAKYAGPRDEYICTGSDSGHAWIYERATGAVAAFLKADNSTCNGVIPHPLLPVFITYGIDSTAKLWRSTIPVDPEVDDSAVGRRKNCRKQAYEMSLTVRSWEEVKSVLENLDIRGGDSTERQIFADHIPDTKVMIRRCRLARTWHRDSSPGSRGITKIGNDLHNLEQTVKENLYTCLRSLYDDDDVPVESDLDELKHRVSTIRLRYQADRLGLRCNPAFPWAMRSQETIATKMEKSKDSPEDHEVAIPDRIPDYPSDVMPSHPEVTPKPFDFRNYFNRQDYTDFYLERYRPLDERNTIDMGFVQYERTNNDAEKTNMDGPEDMDEGEGDCISKESGRSDAEDSKTDDAKMTPEKEAFLRKEPREDGDSFLLWIMMVLKEGGNAALKAGEFDVAARRYDKGIQYAAILYMGCEDISQAQWNKYLMTLLLTRLNMSLLMMKPHFGEFQVAASQAKLALKELAPFCGKDREEGKNKGKGLSEAELDGAYKLRAKAYFRLGSAQVEMGDYAGAVKSFEDSIKSTNQVLDTNVKPDQLAVRRLLEAKRELAKRTKRQRKKFKLAFASTSSPLSVAAASPSLASSSSASSASSSSASPINMLPEPQKDQQTGDSTTADCTIAETASSTSTALISNQKLCLSDGRENGPSINGEGLNINNTTETAQE